MHSLHGHKLLNIAVTLLLLITLFVSICCTGIHLPSVAYTWMIIWFVLAIVASAAANYEFAPCYLINVFSLLVAWRLAALYQINMVCYLAFLAFILLFANFIYCVINNLRDPNQERISLAAWQLIFVRLYIGFDFIPHFTEKLFAGIGPRSLDIVGFTHLGVPDPVFFVWLAGLCELGAAIAIGLGLFMRLGAFGAVLYLMIATYLGHHFSLGFIWANEGGGWEYVVMWSALIFSFVVTGYHQFSLDHYLENKFNLPEWMRKIM